MRSKNHDHDYVPKVGDLREVSYLPRDIRLGHVQGLNEGWCETTGTRQLWLVKGEYAKFIGFIVQAKPAD